LSGNVKLAALIHRIVIRMVFEKCVENFWAR